MTIFQANASAKFFVFKNRLIPIYVAVFAFVSTLVVHIGSGPNWFNVKLHSINCRRSWWQHFLFITNFIPKGADEQVGFKILWCCIFKIRSNSLLLSFYSKQCMTETWYLSNDFQLFLISPLLVYPLWRWKRKGLAVLFLIMLFSLAGNFAMFYIKSMPPTSMITRP